MAERAKGVRGRPPKLRDGVRVGELPTLTVRLPESIKARLLALSGVTGRPAYELIEAALAEQWKSLPGAVRDKTAAFEELKGSEPPRKD